VIIGFGAQGKNVYYCQLKTVVLLNMFVTMIKKDSLMNGKFKRTAFVCNRTL